ncbi:hypothetical protein GQ53DRAFT_740256 [Thozetella sp. PMI_491]|nr:hypothetical protein GQ53DRAFT_740256 [Thozetella sp. PMI_491]
MPQYQFIAIEGHDGKPAKLTGSTRSHAIRAGLQKATRRSKAKTAREPFHPEKRRGEFAALPEPHEKIKTLSRRPRPGTMFSESARPENSNVTVWSIPTIQPEGSKQPPTYRIESMCAGTVDPFDSLPIPTNPNVDLLVKCLLAKDPDFATANPRRSWFPYALQSAPMMHSTLAMTAVLWRAVNPALDSSIQLEGIHQKGEAMREVIDGLARLDAGYNYDDLPFLLSSMSTLVIAEVLDDDLDAAEAHLRGVHNLFSSRDGCDSFLDDFILCKAINLADTQVAAAIGRGLRFPLLHTDHPPIPTYILEHALNIPLDSSLLDDGHGDHTRIFMQLRQLLLARQSFTVSREDLRTLFSIVEGSILQYLYQDCMDASDTSRRSHTLVLAAHVFMYVALREVPTNSPVVRRLCVRLQSAVGRNPSSTELWAENRAALLWIAFVGLLGVGQAATAGPEGQRFLDLFHSTKKAWLDDFHQARGGIRRALAAFLWDETHCQPLLAVLEETGARLPSVL